MNLTLPRQTYIAALEKQLRVLKNGGVEPPVPPVGGVAVPEGSSAPAATGGKGRAPQDEEGANAIRLLTKRNQELQAELEEEKAEVKRRCVCMVWFVLRAASAPRFCAGLVEKEFRQLDPLESSLNVPRGLLFLWTGGFCYAWGCCAQLATFVLTAAFDTSENRLESFSCCKISCVGAEIFVGATDIGSDPVW